jgi:predicted MFS family arabinose efflux permease
MTIAPPVFANPDFRMLFAAAAVSRLGTGVGYVAVPLVAVTALHASPGQVGALATLATAAFLLVGLPAGAWTDRVRRRRVLVVADLVRAALYLSVPLAWWLDVLTMAQLFAVVLASGVGTVFFDVASQSYLPSVVGRPALVAANTRLMAMETINDVAGRGVGGYLVAVLTAPVAVVVDAVSYLASAYLVLRVRHREPVPPRRPDRRLLHEVGAGVRFVVGHPLLRPALIAGGISNLAVSMTVTMLPVIMVVELRRSPAELGLFLAAGGAGAFAGALSARRVAGWFGAGRTLCLVHLATAVLGFVLALVAVGAPLLGALGWFGVTVAAGVNNVIVVSFRQRITPDELLGRMNATFRFLLTGALAVGAGAAGVIGELAGARAVPWVCAAVLAVAWVPVVCSPLRVVRDLPA